MINLTKKAFTDSENMGRKKALAALNTIELFDDGFDDYKIYATGMNCNWDFEVIDNQTKELLAVIEAKDRQMPSTDYRVRKEGTQLEAQKFDSLNEKAERDLIPAYYLATFTDNVFMMWDVTSAPYTEDTRMCNKTTAVNRGKIEKHCYYFATRDAQFKGKY